MPLGPFPQGHTCGTAAMPPDSLIGPSATSRQQRVNVPPDGGLSTTSPDACAEGVANGWAWTGVDSRPVASSSRPQVNTVLYGIPTYGRRRIVTPNRARRGFPKQHIQQETWTTVFRVAHPAAMWSRRPSVCARAHLGSHTRADHPCSSSSHMPGRAVGSRPGRPGGR